MDEVTKITTLAIAIAHAGIPATAMEDALARGREAFKDDTHVDAVSARAWVERLRHSAPHLFRVPTSRAARGIGISKG